MIGFESKFPVAVSQVGPAEWELTANLRYLDPVTDRLFIVPPGQATDFASVPAVLTWLVPNTTGIAAAVLHDWLWREAVPSGEITYRDADRILRQALKDLHVSPLRRATMWAAVRWGALTRRDGWRGWWRDAPAVLTLSVPLLVLAAPALALLPSMLVYAVVEQLSKWVKR